MTYKSSAETAARLAARGERVPKLPVHCPKCGSRDIYAWDEERDGRQWQLMRCPACDYNRDDAYPRARPEITPKGAL